VIRYTRDERKLWRATLGDYSSLWYGSKVGALEALVEILDRARQFALEPHRRATDEKRSCGLCEGWGAPTGCRVCGIRSMGG